MPLLLLVEDTTTDLRIAADMAQQAGFNEIEVSRFAADAHRYLQNCVEGTSPCPDAMVIDLDLGYDSGFEILRFWHSTEALNKIPLIVWSVMGGHESEICSLFHIDRFISKRDSPHVLREALENIIGSIGEAAGG